MALNTFECNCLTPLHFICGSLFITVWAKTTTICRQPWNMHP